MTNRLRRTIAPIAAAASLAGGLAAVAPAHADAASVAHYKNCAALVRVYPHGVRLSAKTQNRYITNGVTHYKATLATVKADVYRANVHLDADRDGIACER